MEGIILASTIIIQSLFNKAHYLYTSIIIFLFSCLENKLHSVNNLNKLKEGN